MTAPNRAPRALLPEGLRDDLPPWAEYEAQMVDRLMAVAAQHGYRRVAPPLVEFEDSLLASSADQRAHFPDHAQERMAERAQSMFRLLDPVSQKMMAVRSDMTLQVARIATARMGAWGRPLRLSYAGHVLRVKGTQLRPARQFRQAGVELIGSRSLNADLEIIALATLALRDLGIAGLSVDLVSPTLVSAIAQQLGLDDAAAHEARRALDAKDAGALADFGDEARGLLTDLMAVAGSAVEALDRLDALPLIGEAAVIRDNLGDLARAVSDRIDDLAVTIDPGESRGFEFQTGVGFAFFAAHVSGELGRGGRYEVIAPDGREESAVGFSMYLDSLLRAVPEPTEKPRIYLPFGTEMADAQRLRVVGWRTVQGLEPVDDIIVQAGLEGCSHVYENGLARSLDDRTPLSEE
ncbi:ATP phosphoribosyltransferase regulatory subunit [Iodidimonas nitroreducens]|uniref:ATP phosphoribosyltransferase regulatory subunit n=1 Tax=Iodidimonas nitroreducens TaxID=1236968 RepID=A0A5A7NAP7_9PROT|nr:ATP phosphoribosyltransferase regulatory subunit [Iodidimonas nitroreducens]GAK34210.1 ATP phosphoribosyltransferase regulatory subunit [alpha proteobacterium Q-1]GER04997.1 ATP phosphoribosyltransferase regulatory subunit [Iodidimonas nitroreducens]